MARDNDDILRAYMDMFHKTVREWVNSSDKYENRNKKRDFSQVMLSMSSFLRRYIGAEKASTAQPKVEQYLKLNRYIKVNDRGRFDLPEDRYNEYKK